MNFPTDRSKTVPPCCSSLFVRLWFHRFWCLRKAVRRNCGIAWVSSLIFLPVPIHMVCLSTPLLD